MPVAPITTFGYEKIDDECFFLRSNEFGSETLGWIKYRMPEAAITPVLQDACCVIFEYTVAWPQQESHPMRFRSEEVVRRNVGVVGSFRGNRSSHDLEEIRITAARPYGFSVEVLSGQMIL